MASIIKKLNKKTGVTYVYESESYWDKEKKQPRSRRKLIGKIDEETGEIVPTGGRGRRKKRKQAIFQEPFPRTATWKPSVWNRQTSSGRTTQKYLH